MRESYVKQLVRKPDTELLNMLEIVQAQIKIITDGRDVSLERLNIEALTELQEREIEIIAARYRKNFKVENESKTDLFGY